jgi:hypothetical protein
MGDMRIFVGKDNKKYVAFNDVLKFATVNQGAVRERLCYVNAPLVSGDKMKPNHLGKTPKKMTKFVECDKILKLTEKSYFTFKYEFAEAFKEAIAKNNKRKRDDISPDVPVLVSTIAPTEPKIIWKRATVVSVLPNDFVSVMVHKKNVEEYNPPKLFHIGRIKRLPVKIKK